MVKKMFLISPIVISTVATNAKANINSLAVCDSKKRNNGDIPTLCELGQLKEAINVLKSMDLQRVTPDILDYISLLQCCAYTKALPEGKLFHARILQARFPSHVHLDNKLVIMYAKCGNMVDARAMFDKMLERNVVSWTAIISAYAKAGYGEVALNLYSQMKSTGCQPDEFTLTSVISACSSMEDIQQGKELHEEIKRSGFVVNVFVESALIDMYVKCRSLRDARDVFDRMTQRNVVSWTSMIAGYARNGYVDEALVLFENMPSRDLVSWNVMIAGYGQHGRLEKALELFQRMPERDAVSWNAMLAGYTDNGFLDVAFDFFNKMPKRNVVSWNTMIAAYVRQGHEVKALNLFKQMKLGRFQPDRFTFVSVLTACANLAILEYGKEVHGVIINSRIQSNALVRSSLIDMYAKCGGVRYARTVFDEMPLQNIELWNVMIAGYAHNALIDKSLKLFEQMTERNVESWNSLIGGYLQNGYFDRTVEIYQQMQLTGLKPDLVTVISVLPALANLAALHLGRKLHKVVLSSGLMSDAFVASSLVDMYAKCGNIPAARKMFDQVSPRDVVSWSAIIVGYAMHGNAMEAIKLFNKMLQRNLKPNSITFVGVLLACCHAGLVDDGWKYFNCMSEDYHVTPGVKHYCCMVDLLCRSGRLDKAYDFINKMPIKPDAAVWSSLLGGCRIHGDIELGELVADHLFKADSKNPSHYVLLSNIYATTGSWNKVEQVRKMMNDRGVEKLPGCSWIEINNKVHAFVVGD